MVCLQGAMTTTADQSNAGPSYMQQDAQNTEAAIASPESSTASEGRYCKSSRALASPTQSDMCLPALTRQTSKHMPLESAIRAALVHIHPANMACFSHFC